jgi:localization factor PodJL
MLADGRQSPPKGKKQAAAALPGSPDEPSTDDVETVRKRAAGGEAPAQYDLGALFMSGRGVPRDTESAALWFEKAASQGYVPAQFVLAYLYEHAIGVIRDLSRAREFYRHAAESGHIKAMHKLGYFLAVGVGGDEDPATAARWFWRAAEAGVKDSQLNLGLLYASGVGVEQSFTQAYVWFSRAAAQGYAPAAKMRDAAAARLNAEELETARALAAHFKPKSALDGAGRSLTRD